MHHHGVAQINSKKLENSEGSWPDIMTVQEIFIYTNLNIV